MKITIKDVTDFRTTIAKAGHSLSSLATEIGSTKAHISLVASGNRNVSPKLAKKICEALGKTFDDIFLTQVSSNDDKKTA